MVTLNLRLIALLTACCSLLSAILFISPLWAGELVPFRASPDQVLVLYNADWKKDTPGSDPGQDSKEVAEYYAAVHTDPVSGKKPYLLGLSCRHIIKGDHLNHWFIKEESNDNANGIIYKGKEAPPEGDWTRDSRKVEIKVDDPNADWDSAVVTCRSKIADREVTLARRQGPAADRNNTGEFYTLSQSEKGGTITFDASRIFSGPVIVGLKLKNRSGKTIRDLSLRYYDHTDFSFTPTGPDGVPDDRALEEDVLTPVRTFLEDRANALPDGTLLKDHILYIVVVHGMPYSSKGVFGIERGVTSNKNDHGTLASLEQRLQTIYYGWDSFRPPVISFTMGGGPDSDKGVVNHIITTALRHPLMDRQWNPYMHPDTYSFLKAGNKAPFFYDLAPLGRRRQVLPREFFIYAVTRIDGADAEEAKRVIDYSIYATRYLRPEMDCRVRAALAREGKASLSDLSQRVKQAEEKNLWGGRELQALGFVTAPQPDSEGLPFLVKPEEDVNGKCADTKTDWKVSGFYPGGMDRYVKSENGLNLKDAAIWKYIGKGVTVSAAGAPAGGWSGGPHITNASFWDNRILTKYLFRGRDLGESFLISIIYTNWSTSLLGDPLMHPDLRQTAVDTVPPAPQDAVSIKLDDNFDSFDASLSVALKHDPANPEVAELRATFRDKAGQEIHGVSPLYSRKPQTLVKGLLPETEYTVKPALIDPYGNRTELAEMTVKTGSPSYSRSILKKMFGPLPGGK